MKRPIRPDGFSLIEAVVVLVIAGILLVLAIPIFSDQETKAAYFHEQVKAGVRYAQRQAVAQRRCVFVSATSSQLALFYGNSSCAITAVPVADLATGGAYVLVAPSGLAITPAQFSFNGLGQPSAAVAFAVGSHSVTVQPETGYVQ